MTKVLAQFQIEEFQLLTFDVWAITQKQHYNTLMLINKIINFLLQYNELFY